MNADPNSLIALFALFSLSDVVNRDSPAIVWALSRLLRCRAAGRAKKGRGHA